MRTNKDRSAGVTPSFNQLRDVNPRTAQEQVVEILRHAILGGELAAGTPLILAQLSERLGVSRTPIREALRDLAAEDLVDFDSYRSAVVHTPTVEEAQEIYALRILLDPYAVSLAIDQITAEELDQAGAIHKQMLATGDVGDWVELNRDFHGLLVNASRSPRLIRIISSLRNSAAIQVSLSIQANEGEIERSNVDHEAILEAFRAGDSARAQQLTVDHLQRTLELIEEYESSRV